MTEFKAGDKVRYDSKGVYYTYDGLELVILGPYRGCKDAFRVKVVKGNGKISVGAERVLLSTYYTLIKPEPKFKVGDKVVQKAGVYGHAATDTLTVDKINGANHNYGHGYTVVVRNQNGLTMAYKPSELELAPYTKKYSVGFHPYANGGLTTSTTTMTRLTVPKKAEAVDGPAHYGGKDNPYEVIKVAEAWGFNQNAYLFNALKYLGRCEHKGSKVKDLEKLIDYAKREIALEEAK